MAILVAPADASKEERRRADINLDGIADDIEINAALSCLEMTGGTIEICDGTVNLNGSVIMPRNTALRLGHNTRIKVGANVHGLVPSKNCAISGGAIDVTGAERFDRAAIFFDCRQQFNGMNRDSRVTGVFNMNIYGLNRGGQGICILADDPEGAAWSVGTRIENVNIVGFEDGMRLEAISPTTPGAYDNFVKGNQITNVMIWSSVIGFHLQAMIL